MNKVAVYLTIILSGLMSGWNSETSPLSDRSGFNANQVSGTCKIYIDYRSFQHEPHRKFEWLFNNTIVKVDTAKSPFVVPVHEKFDTIFFVNPWAKFTETILCDLRPGEEYVITYNMCCGDFYVWMKDKAKRGKTEHAQFRISGKSTKQLIGTNGLNGAFLKSGRTVGINARTHSAMASNWHPIAVQEFKEESLDSTLSVVINPRTRKDITGFKNTKNKLVDFYYIFLENDTLLIDVDLKNNKTHVERINRKK